MMQNLPSTFVNTNGTYFKILYILAYNIMDKLREGFKPKKITNLLRFMDKSRIKLKGM